MARVVSSNPLGKTKGTHYTFLTGRIWKRDWGGRGEKIMKGLLEIGWRRQREEGGSGCVINIKYFSVCGTQF